MMDKKAILENGILEQYLLGELNTDQEIQIERILNSDPELKERFNRLEADFEIIGQENAIIPPAFVKDKLMSSLHKKDAKVITMQTKRNSNSYTKIAASIAGFLLISSIWLFSQLNNLKAELKVVQQENVSLNEDLKNLNTSLSETNKWYTAINDQNAKKYILKGNASFPDAVVISYVNHQQKSVIINTKKLPKLDKSKDYQMWADVEGEMINMGVIDKEKEMLAMTYIENAESLNITIEPAGGNDHPTVSQLITNIYLE